MGIINSGIPVAEALFLKRKLMLSIFLETGTYRGDTAKSMSNYFEKVYTIEKSEYMYNIAKEVLKGYKNVELLKGDSRDILPKILYSCANNILFWLDAHWSGGKTWGEGDECPLLKELQVIFAKCKRKNYAILIDDARLFLAPPPLPHDWKSWPTIADIIKIIPKGFDLVIFNDVIYIYPNKISSDFRNFIQELTTKAWKEHEQSLSFMYGIRIAIKSLLKGKFL